MTLFAISAVLWSHPLFAQFVNPDTLIVGITAIPSSNGIGPTQEQLSDATTVLLTSKLPKVSIYDSAPLRLVVGTACLPASGGGDVLACDVDMKLRLYRAGWSSPFAHTPSITLWQRSAMVVALRSRMANMVRSAIDQDLDEPIAAWQRLPNDMRRCWTVFLEHPTTLTQVFIGGKETDMSPSLFVVNGPCVSDQQP